MSGYLKNLLSYGRNFIEELIEPTAPLVVKDKEAFLAGRSANNPIKMVNAEERLAQLREELGITPSGTYVTLDDAAFEEYFGHDFTEHQISAAEANPFAFRDAEPLYVENSVLNNHEFNTLFDSLRNFPLEDRMVKISMVLGTGVGVILLGAAIFAIYKLNDKKPGEVVVIQK